MPFLYKKITKALLIYKIEKETSFFHKENLSLSLRLFFNPLAELNRQNIYV